VSTVDYTVAAREWRLRLPDPPPVEGTTSGLRAATCYPERVTLVAYDSGEARAVCEGPRRLADGSTSRTWVTVTVALVTVRDTRYAAAPAWLSEVYDRVRG
jgi:hypothetical protein